MKSRKFTTKELCIMAVMAALGMVAKPLFAPVFNVITDFVKIPGGSTTAGISMLFLVFTAALTGKAGTASLMGITQAFISLGTGIGSNAGILVLITYTVPGVAIDLVMCSHILSKLDGMLRMMLAGALGVVCGAMFTNMLYFRMPVVSFILFYIFGILSGALGGYLAWLIYKRIPKSVKENYHE